MFIYNKNNILYDEFINEIKYELGIIKKTEIDLNNYKFENMHNFKTLNDTNQERIYCLKTLDD
jgi:hypothetical protein